MKANLDHCLDLVGLSEAGYWDDPAAGPTNHGITHKTLAAWRGVPSVTEQQVRELTPEEARQILTKQYAVPVGFDVLPAGLDYVALDYGVNSGPGRAVCDLQHALGMPAGEVDGVFGAHTKAAVDAVTDVDMLIITYCQARLAFMRTLRNWRPNANGWEARVKRVQSDALVLADGLNPPARTVVAAPESMTKAAGPTKLSALPSGKAAIAAVVTTAAAASAAAAQATGLLSPYGDVQIVRYVLVGLALISSIGTVVVAAGRAANGATT